MKILLLCLMLISAPLWSQSLPAHLNVTARVLSSFYFNLEETCKLFGDRGQINLTFHSRTNVRALIMLKVMFPIENEVYFLNDELLEFEKFYILGQVSRGAVQLEFKIDVMNSPHDYCKEVSNLMLYVET